jgi:ribosomal protein L30E
MTSDLKKEIAEKAHVIGADRVKKGIINEEFSRICVASNFKDKELLRTLCNAHDVKLEELDITNRELATLCKKTYSIGVIGFNKK